MLDFQHQQSAFAAYLRNPENQPAPAEIEERRMRIYRDLFFNNIQRFISSAFPVLKSLHNDQQWQALVRDFYSTHKASTPYFLEISEEFLAWLENDKLPIHQQFPFAKELAHYEWVELGLDVANDISSHEVDVSGDLLTCVPVVSPLAWSLVYEWPVHLIGKDYVPESPLPQPTCLVVYRNGDDKVEFLEANPVTLRLLEMFSDDANLTGELALQQLAAELQQVDVSAFVSAGLDVLQRLRSLDIIAGVRPSSCLK